MVHRRKKVGIAGKFGPRYGVKIRKQVHKIESTKRKKHQCPTCMKRSVKRLSSGIWKCNSCGTTFAGGAYTPVTGSARARSQVFKQIAGKEDKKK
jgi:large subunit ribosomal protein L37Ae